MKDLVRLMRRNFVPITLKALKSDKGFVVEWTESTRDNKVFKCQKLVSSRLFKDGRVALPSGFRTGVSSKSREDVYTAEELAEEITKRSIKEFFSNIHLDPNEVDAVWDKTKP